jgi:SAM-dependent methyltransferase
MMGLMVAGARETNQGGMQKALFSLLDPLVAGRPFTNVLESGVSAVCDLEDLERRYDWKLRSAGAGCNLSSLPFEDGSFDAVLALDEPARIERALGEVPRVLAHGGLLVLGVLSGGISRKSLISLAERQPIRVLRFSRIWPAAWRFGATVQALALRAGLSIPAGRSVILIGEKTA